MEPAHVQRKRLAKVNIQQQILDAALTIANEHNWEAVTIRKIAEAVAYTTTIVYNYFDGKDDLLQAISDRGFRQLYELIDASIVMESDPGKQLSMLSIINWDFASANRKLYQLMFSLKHPSPNTVKDPMVAVKAIFEKLSDKTGQDVENLVLNWMCVRQGCINTLLGMSSEIVPEHTKKELYVEFMDRFIKSIEGPANINTKIFIPCGHQL